MIILDTNVASELMRDEPHPAVVAWLDSLSPESLWLTSITVFEIQFGIETLANGRRRRQLNADFDRMVDAYDRRILPFDDHAGRASAKIAAIRERGGRTVEIRDTMIAGIVVSRGAELATRNVRHFQDLDTPVIDPWTL